MGTGSKSRSGGLPMSATYLNILAPLDPYFRPNLDMLKQILVFMQKYKFLEEETELDKKNNNYVSLFDIHLFPKSLRIPHPNSWNRETISWFSRIFSFDLEEYYEDVDKLRDKREPIPGSDNDTTFKWNRMGYFDFSCDKLELIAPYLTERYYLRLLLAAHNSFLNELLTLGCSAYDSRIFMRYGFHCEEHVGALLKSETYLKGFPYAPPNYFTDVDNNLYPVISYAGSFSIAVSTYNPPVLFTSWDTFNEDQFLDNLETFKQKCSFYTILKPGLEDIFQQPVDLFLGAWY
jgi:hypothetical protein